MKFSLYSLIVVVIAFSGCRKKDFPETVTDPAGNFYFTGTIEGVPVSIKAGKQSYYMYASYTGASDSFYTYVADLRIKDCNNCPNSLQIRINDRKSHLPGANYSVDSAISTLNTYPIRGATYYKVKFNGFSNQQAVSYRWDFGDGQSSAEAAPEHAFNSAGIYSVSLRITSDYGCQQYISNKEKISDSASVCQILATHQNGTFNTLKFSTNLSGTGNSLLWNFGDGTFSSQVQPNHSYAIAGTYPVTLRVVRNGGDTIYAKRNVATITSPMPCLTNYNIESVKAMSWDVFFSKVIINWTDELGQVYTSNSDFAQPATNFFKIISVEDFDKNENGQLTKKIKVNFSCNVYNGTKVKRITNAEAVLGIAYK